MAHFTYITHRLGEKADKSLWINVSQTLASVRNARIIVKTQLLDTLLRVSDLIDLGQGSIIYTSSKLLNEADTVVLRTALWKLLLEMAFSCLRVWKGGLVIHQT